MARPLKYGEKTSVRNITIPDSMWEALPSPKSQWVVEAVRQFQELPNRAEGGAGETEDRGVPMNVATPSASTEVSAAVVDPEPQEWDFVEKPSTLEVIQEPVEMTPEQVEVMLSNVPEPIRSELPDPECSHPKARQVNVMGGRRCLDCGKLKPTNGAWG
jgi:hypothetical protein